MIFLTEFEKKCSNCIFCSIDKSISETDPELWCDNENSKYNNGNEIIDELATGGKCNLFKNKNIEHDEEFEEYEISECYSHGRYIKCQSDNFNRLNEFVSHRYELIQEVDKYKEKAKELQEILEFFKSELPEVYRKLLQEYKKIKKCE